MVETFESDIKAISVGGGINIKGILNSDFGPRNSEETAVTWSYHDYPVDFKAWKDLVVAL